MHHNQKPQRHSGCRKLSHQQVKSAISSGKALHALTSAALVLPGLFLSPGHAGAKDRINFQYSRYQEGERNLYGAPHSLKPITADVLHGSGLFSLTDRTTFSISYTQDTWTGATPVSTTPLATTGGNRPYFGKGGVVAGASPILQSDVLLNRDLSPIGRDPITKQLTGDVDPRSVLVMVSASPETRRQATFGLSHEWNEAAINIAGGFSRERDYKSSFGNIGGRLDFNQKLTTVKFNGGYTSSEIGAILDHDSLPYINKTAYLQQIVNRKGAQILRDDRQDWVANIGLTQVLSKNAYVDASVGYTHSSGFLENPYKAMSFIFVDPAELNNGLSSPVTGKVRAFIEQRPGARNQVALNAKYVHYIQPFNAAMHLGYRLSVDDWGVNTHTFDASWVQPLGSGWTLTPRIRYYSQDSASFYQPYLLTQQAFEKTQIDGRGREIYFNPRNPDALYFREDVFNYVDQNGNPVDDALVQTLQPRLAPYQLPKNFSSDHRLAGFGALSGGVVLSKLLGKGVALEAGFEYYTRASSMQIGTGGNNSFADFDYYVANAAVRFDIEPVSSMPVGTSAGSHESHGHAAAHHHKIPPAGIMFGHMLDKAGDFMAGYRFMYNWTGGNMRHGTHGAGDQAIIDQGCGGQDCQFTPANMDMRMHMLDLMYAPTRWLNVMLMPTFMDMDMNLRELSGTKEPLKSSAHASHANMVQETGALSDTYFSGLIKLVNLPGHRLHANLGMSAPTGKTDIEMRRSHTDEGGLMHFGMQLGSGTWDFMPSLTYAGEKSRWSWGAQFSGIKRLEEKNKSGYRLGDMVQATAWSGFDLTHWLTATVRGAFTWQDRIHRDFDDYNARLGPMDFPRNYGGQFWDMGFGVNARIPVGRFSGNRLAVEWIQPISNDFNGFQVNRQGSLAATWSYHF